ncbi:MAG: inositol monophosphatase [Clostridia bacterium]|nr:inositol monophosphatase [Clostridia bacterium]
MIDYERVEHLVRQAGQMIRDAHVTGEQVHTKRNRADFVTDYDLRVQQYLIDNLKPLVPEAVFYGEEDTVGNDGRNSEEGFCFYLDPIDGTTNFVFGYHHSCTSVGIGLDGRIIAGFVYNPYNHEMYRAVRGQGAFLNDRRLWVENRELQEGILAFNGPVNRDNEGPFFEILRILYGETYTIRSSGSAALDLCRVASGGNVAYVQDQLSPYDYAAASVIVEEAGGVITQVDGSPVSLESNCSVVAGAPLAYERTREIVLSILNKK